MLPSDAIVERVEFIIEKSGGNNIVLNVDQFAGSRDGSWSSLRSDDTQWEGGNASYTMSIITAGQNSGSQIPRVALNDFFGINIGAKQLSGQKATPSIGCVRSRVVYTLPGQPSSPTPPVVVSTKQQTVTVLNPSSSSSVTVIPTTKSTSGASELSTTTATATATAAATATKTTNATGSTATKQMAAEMTMPDDIPTYGYFLIALAIAVCGLSLLYIISMGFAAPAPPTTERHVSDA